MKGDDKEGKEKDGHIVIKRKVKRAVTLAMRFETTMIKVVGWIE